MASPRKASQQQQQEGSSAALDRQIAILRRVRRITGDQLSEAQKAEIDELISELEDVRRTGQWVKATKITGRLLALGRVLYELWEDPPDWF